VRDKALRAAERLVRVLGDLDRTARREHRTVPRASECRVVHAAFWNELIPALAAAERHVDPLSLTELRADVQALVRPLLWRSRFWSRSALKPHGYPGDFRIIEWIYDLEEDACVDPTQPALINLLDGLFRSVHSVRAVWHRRAWFANVIASRLDGSGSQPRVRVLDVACGGSRYLRDVVGRHGPFSVAATFLDQDPAALAFIEASLPVPTRLTSRTICAPVWQLRELVRPSPDTTRAPFDVVVSTGLFDYLSDDHARGLLAHMVALARPHGTVAICNFSPDDRSRVVKDWIVDWPLIYRSRSQLLQLFPRGLAPCISESADGGLLCARVDV
jgi:SAM-dependent methyltransferase